MESEVNCPRLRAEPARQRRARPGAQGAGLKVGSSFPRRQRDWSQAGRFQGSDTEARPAGTPQRPGHGSWGPRNLRPRAPQNTPKAPHLHFLRRIQPGRSVGEGTGDERAGAPKSAGPWARISQFKCDPFEGEKDTPKSGAGRSLCRVAGSLGADSRPPPKDGSRMLFAQRLRGPWGAGTRRRWGAVIKPPGQSRAQSPAWENRRGLRLPSAPRTPGSRRYSSWIRAGVRGRVPRGQYGGARAHNDSMWGAGWGRGRIHPNPGPNEMQAGFQRRGGLGALLEKMQTPLANPGRTGSIFISN